jgi:DNA-binding PadR family transcriptional regulator
MSAPDVTWTDNDCHGRLELTAVRAGVTHICPPSIAVSVASAGFVVHPATRVDRVSGRRHNTPGFLYLDRVSGVTRTRRPSPQTAAVLSALAAEPSAWRYGYELGRQVGLKAGSLYPILIRLCDRRLLEATWEADPPPGRPPRHLYRLTGAGVRLAEEVAVPADRTTTTTLDGRRRGELRGAW